MPTALASAPAQCEFCGGIEVYTTMPVQLFDMTIIATTTTDDNNDTKYDKCHPQE